jgi:hypothetical protein
VRVNAKSKVVWVELDVTLTSAKVSVGVIEFDAIMFVCFFQKGWVMVRQGFDFPHDMMTL